MLQGFDNRLILSLPWAKEEQVYIKWVKWRAILSSITHVGLKLIYVEPTIWWKGVLSLSNWIIALMVTSLSFALIR